MKFIFETMRFLSKYIALNQQITYLMTFHTYFTAFQTAAPRRITEGSSTHRRPLKIVDFQWLFFYGRPRFDAKYWNIRCV